MSGGLRPALVVVPAALGVLAGCASTAASSAGVRSAPPADSAAAAAAYSSAYTCPLVLSVTVAPSDAAARAA